MEIKTLIEADTEVQVEDQYFFLPLVAVAVPVGVVAALVEASAVALVAAAEEVLVAVEQVEVGRFFS